jgi:hypothetical protein
MGLAAAAAVLVTLGLSGLNVLPAKAGSTFTKSWFSMEYGMCLGVLGGNITPLQPVVQAPCDGSANQSWQIQTVQPQGIPGGNWTQIQNSANLGYCLGVYAAETADGSNLVIYPCNGHPDQSWYFFQVVPGTRGASDGCFTIENFNAIPKVIGILGASPQPLAQAVIWDNLTPSHTDQIFCPTPV